MTRFQPSLSKVHVNVWFIVEDLILGSSSKQFVLGLDDGSLVEQRGGLS